MSLASLSNIEKTFGQRVIFDKLNLTVYEGERIGFIGANGSGKTTLFKVITGQTAVDVGNVAIARGVKVGYLAQDPVFDANNTVNDEAEQAFGELHDLSHRLRELEHAMGGKEGEELERVLKQYQNTQHEFDLAGGYAWRHRLEATLQGVGLEPATWEQAVGTLSGGQRSRLALAKLLISEPDLLLLDEPTNHLDLAAIEWLEKYLMEFKGAVVIISHDRFLLDRLATRIVWLNLYRLDSFKGNYSAFVQQRELIELTQARQYEQQQAYIDKQQEFIRRFQAGQRAREAKGRASRLDTLLHSEDLVKQVAKQRHIKLSLNTDQRAGDQVLNVRELSKGFGEKKLWDRVTLLVRRGERVGIIGPNGSGKTTMLRVLLGHDDADDGDVKWGANLNIGYYDQRLDQFDPENSVMEEAAEGRTLKEKELRDVLAMMLFRGDDIYKPMGLLSGGERARVRLAQLLLDKPNVLVLDEPTNHLDIASCEALERAMKQFAGTILCVSHDRYFLDKVVGRLLVISLPKVIDFAGNYSAWQAKQNETEQRAAATKAQRSKGEEPVKQPQRAAPRKDNPYLRPFGRLSIGELEQQIQDTEVRLAECQADFGNPDVFKDSSRSTKLHEEYEALGKKLQQLEEEYFARESS